MRDEIGSAGSDASAAHDAFLSTPLSQWRLGDDEPVIEAVIIGSGYGGAVSALRLAEAGVEVVVFERGSEYLPGQFPNDPGNALKHLREVTHEGAKGRGRANGLFEWHRGEGMVALTANGVGGGSLINAGVVIEPMDEVFKQKQWPAALRAHEPNSPWMSMEQALARARRGLAPITWNAMPALAKSEALAALRPGVAGPVDVTIDDKRCIRCGDCATGCNHGAKRTLRDTHLRPAVEKGAQLVVSATAWEIRALGEREWRICFFPTDQVDQIVSGVGVSAATVGRTVRARLLIVAAGTFGSTTLLQRSADSNGLALSTKLLGRRISANGDSLSFIVNEAAPVNAFGAGATPLSTAPGATFQTGPTITTMLDLRQGPQGPIPLKEQVLIQEGAVPGALGTVADELLATSYLVHQLDHLHFELPANLNGHEPLAGRVLRDRTQVLLTMGHDEAKGELRWDRNAQKSALRWDAPESDAAFIHQARVFADLAQAGRTHLHPPTWQPLPQTAEAVMSGKPPPRTIVTVHPLGGCAMGDDFVTGVVDHLGRVFRSRGKTWPTLRVLDGSIIPTSLGANPLLTITALAERSIDQWLRSNRRAAGPGLNGPAQPPASTFQPVALQRHDGAGAPEWPTAIDSSLTERLLCHRLKGLAGSIVKPFEFAELELEMGATDWMGMWLQGNHMVQARSGMLRLAKDGESPELRYAVLPGSGGFELLPYRGEMAFSKPHGQGTRRPWWRRWWDALSLVRAGVTWLLSRGIDDLARAAVAVLGRWLGVSPKPAEASIGLGARIRALVVGLAHAAETREMRYRLVLKRRRGVGRGWSAFPDTLTVLGTKRIRYGADLSSLLAWPLRFLRALLGNGGLAPPKRPYWNQVFDPSIVILKGQVSPWREALARHHPRLAGAWIHGNFEVDLPSLLQQAPLHLNTGDLTNGVVALSAYPLLFGRHAVKTQLFDFRLPDYGMHQSRRNLPLKVGRLLVVPTLYALNVPRGYSDSDPVDGLPKSLTLELRHYAAPVRKGPALVQHTWGGHAVWKARTVLLLHAFAQAGSMFTMPRPHPSLAAHLLEAGYDVWVLEHRISIDLPFAKMPSNMVQIARLDIPRAVNFILESLKSEHHADLVGDAVPLLQIFAFGQCIGGASLAMSLLDGRLSYGLTPTCPLDEGSAPLPHMPKLAGAVISQTHPYLIGTPQTQSKTWVPAFIRDSANRDVVPFAVQNPPDDLVESWMDRLFASMPVPRQERCPGEIWPTHRQNDCATCRRIRFIEAPLFLHKNLSPATHRALPQLFGDANVHLFAHAARCVVNERLVDDEGQFIFVTDERMRTHFGLPLAFLHGEKNELFHVSSARRSGEQYSRMFPAMAARVDAALGLQACKNSAWVIKDHGHVDVVLGRHAPEQVFEPMSNLFNSLLATAEPQGALPDVTVPITLRAPLAGPMLGSIRRVIDGTLRVRVAFLIDDRFSDGKSPDTGKPGTRTWALVRTGEPAQAYHLMHIRLGRARKARKGGSSGYRIAHGDLVLPPPKAGQPIELLAFSLHEAIVARTEFARLRAAEFAERPQALEGSWSRCEAGNAAFDALDKCVKGLLDGRTANADRGWADANALDPSKRNPSSQRRTARAPALGKARILPASIEATRPTDGVNFYAACCRYPGWPFDRQRVDQATRRLIDIAQRRSAGLAFGLLLGDQVYADATAGLVDPLTAVERYFERYRTAFGRETRRRGQPDNRSLGDLLATLPTYLTCDDHEFRNGFPDGAAVDARFEPDSRRGRRSRMVAADALNSFQTMHMPDRRRGRSYQFRHGPMRCFVLDTRSERLLPDARHPQRSLLRLDTLHRLRRWLFSPYAASHLNCIASGSVLLPRLVAGSDPTHLQDDSIGWSPHDRDALLALVRDACAQRIRVLLLSGDYHVSSASTLSLDSGGQAACAAAIVVPPLYAPLPYANTAPCEMDFAEKLSPWNLRQVVVPGSVAEGSGFARIRVARTCCGGFSIRLARWLVRHERHDRGGRAAPPVHIELA